MAYTLQTKKSDGTLEDVTIETITIDITSYKNKAIPSTIYNLLKNSQSSKVIVDNEIYYMTSNNGSVLKFSYCNETYLKCITINSNGSSWSIASSSLDNKLDKNKQLVDYNANPTDDYTDLTLLDKTNSTLVGIPFRKINGESIIGKDPLTISGGGTSHPIYTETDTDKYTVTADTNNNQFLITFTGESGSRYYFNFAKVQYSFGGTVLDHLSFKILNSDVKVFAYTKGEAINTIYHSINNVSCVFLHNDKFLSVVLTDYVMNSCKWTTYNAQDTSMGNSYIEGNEDYYVSVANNDTNFEVQYLLLTLYKNEVGTLEVVVEQQGDI